METGYGSLDTQDPRLKARGRRSDKDDGRNSGSLREQLRQSSPSSFDELTRPSRVQSRSTVSGSRPRSSKPSTWTARLGSCMREIWQRHRAILLMLAAQFFGVSMNMCAQLLEHEDDGGMQPMQLLFMRMAITLVISNLYMWWAKTPDAPFGKPGIRWLLMVRGVTGFVGIFGMWQSIIYLPLAEATVITFLVPCVTGYLCHVFIHEPFTRKEQLASFVALVGVLLIARPAVLLGLDNPPADNAAPGISRSNMSVAAWGSHRDEEDATTPTQRLGAIAVALLGVLGTSGAFMTIRHIGPRAHPFVSVNYFSMFCTGVCTVVLALAPVVDVGQPGLQFGLPHGPWQWFLLTMLSICGFLTQSLLTASLGGGEKSNRATAMVYTGMLFASAFDRWVFGVEMGALSVVGCGLIIGSAMWAALSKKESTPEARREDVEAAMVLERGDSEVAHLLAGCEQADGEEEEEGMVSG